jgi:serine/threonine-protein kinase
VKILDFGVAKLRGKDAATKETNRLTETGAMIGTPHYMAPEQAFGEGEIDLRADLWAVGAVLYECIAGVPPTNGENLGQILKALATGAIAPLAELVPGAPHDVCALVDRLLRIEREERPASAEEVIAAIDALEPASRAAGKSAPLAASAMRARDLASTPPPATNTAHRSTLASSLRGRFAMGTMMVLAAAASVIGFTMFRSRPVRIVATAERPPEASVAAHESVTPPPSAPTIPPTASAVSSSEAIAAGTSAKSRSRAPTNAGRAAVAPPSSSAAGPLLTTVPF